MPLWLLVQTGPDVTLFDRAPANHTITAVPGIRVGHAVVPGGGSGCTVVLGPFRGVVEVRGGGPGSRELATLELDHLVPRVDALLLTGGSAFGLAAADGVMEWLASRGLGFNTPAGPVPIVPGAVIYDLVPGGARPGSREGRAACDAASGAPVPTGRVGAGAGATVGKLGGANGTSPGGVGSAVMRVGRYRVGALAVVNAIGDVLDARGNILAGARTPDGRWMDSSAMLLGDAAPPVIPGPHQATTLCVVATDAPLSRVNLSRMVRVAGTALSRRIAPVHTPFDGDLTFCVSTAPEEESISNPELLALGTAGRAALEAAIEGAVV